MKIRPGNDKSRIFDEFEQVENPYTKKQTGTGLGLPIVKRLVALHHGSLSLISDSGKGTEMIVLLPLSQAAEATGEETDTEIMENETQTATALEAGIETKTK